MKYINGIRIHFVQPHSNLISANALLRRRTPPETTTRQLQFF